MIEAFCSNLTYLCLTGPMCSSIGPLTLSGPYGKYVLLKLRYIFYSSNEGVIFTEKTQAKALCRALPSIAIHTPNVILW